MAVCDICGKKTGLFGKSHKECVQKAQVGWEQMVGTASAAIASGEYVEGTLVGTLGEIGGENFIPATEIRKSIIAGWLQRLDEYLDDGLLSLEEDESLCSALEFFHITQDDFEDGESFLRLSRARVLRDFMEGENINSFQSDVVLPFNLQKSESLIWVFDEVQYYKETVQREIRGQSLGGGMRVAGGAYLRTGAFTAKPVEKVTNQHLGTGILGLTNKHLYFSGGRSSFRIPYGKIVSVQPYTDGVGVMRDNATAKPEMFANLDGWFTYNVVTNLS